MASKTHLNKLIQLSNNEEAALANLNANVDILNDVIDDYVSRSGLVPTQLQEPLDLGNQRIINVGTPESDNDVVRYKDVKDALDELHSIEADLQDVENAVIRANNAASSADQSAGIATAAKVDAIDAKNDAVSAKNAAVQAKDDITTLLTVDYPEITTVANNISDVQTVAGISTDVSAVAGVASDVSDVADIVSDVSTVANVDSDVSTVAGIASDVSAVAGVSTAVQAVEDNLTAVQNAAQNATDAANSAELAHKWATSSTVVESGQYGASYYALRAANYMNGAESARDLARNWANKTDGAVADNEYSAKHYAEQAAAIVAVLGTVMTYKGSVASYADLPSSGNTTGDVWNVLDTGKNYAWAGSAWDDFGGAITVSIAACSDVSLTTPATGEVLIYNSVSGKWENGTVDSLPSQTGQTGKFLTTDGTNASWVNPPTELPSQAGHLGMFLKTNGTNVSWSSIPPELPNTSGQSGKFLTNDGTDVSWADVPSGGASSLTDIAQAGTGIVFGPAPDIDNIASGDKIGSPTISDSGLFTPTSSAYLKITGSSVGVNVAYPITNGGYNWEFTVKVKTPPAYETGKANNLWHFAPYFMNSSGLYVDITDEGKLNFGYWKSGDWYYIEGTDALDTNTWYYVRVTHNSSTGLKLESSKDGTTWKEEGTSSTTGGFTGQGTSQYFFITHVDSSKPALQYDLTGLTYKSSYNSIDWVAYVDGGDKTEISTNAIINARSDGAVIIKGTDYSSSGTYDVCIGEGTSVGGGASVAIGYNCQVSTGYGSDACGIAIGYNCRASFASIAIGRYAKAEGDNGRYGIAIGYGSQVTTYGGIQLGGQNFTNNDDHSMYVGLYNGSSWANYKLLNKDGTIPAERLVNAISSTSVTLEAASWSSNAQTVTVTGMTSTSKVWVSPAPASTSGYASNGVLCTAQGTNSLTFECTSTPSSDLTVNVIFG